MHDCIKLCLKLSIRQVPLQHLFCITPLLDILYLELGVGGNTPGIIKYPFWQMTYKNPDATYICINLSEAYIPTEIKKQSIGIADDIGEVLTHIKNRFAE